MLNYLLRRFSLLLSTLFMLSLLAFTLGQLLPGDPVHNYSGLHEVNNEDYQRLSDKYHINEGYLSQYLGFLERIAGADFGVSASSQMPVASEITQVLPASIELSLYALILVIIVAVPLGLLAGLKHDKLVDRFIYAFSVIGNSIPLFWLGILLILFFSLNLHWLPMSGRVNYLYEIPDVTGFILIDILRSDLPYKYEALNDAIRHLILPTLTLAMMPLTLILSITRSSVINVMQTSYIKAAQTKGLSFAQLARRHVFRNALLPVIPQLGLAFNLLMTSTMITEVIFSWPGIGKWLIEAIYQRDFPAIQAGLLVVATFVIIVHIAIDVLYNVLNPIMKK